MCCTAGTATPTTDTEVHTTEVDTRGLLRDTICVICMDKEGDHVLLPCGHGGYCGGCAHTLLKQARRTRLCPICRAALRAAARVHLSTPVGEEGDVLDHSTARSAGGKRRLRETRAGSRGGHRRDASRPASAVSATVYGANTIATSTTPNTGTNVNVYDGGTV